MEPLTNPRCGLWHTGMGELAGATMGNNISLLLPSEIQKLALPALRPLFYLQYIERTLLEYEVKGKSEQERGPLVLCIDVSGSMEAGGNAGPRRWSWPL